MDTWLKYIIQNLNEMDDIAWVQKLAETINKNERYYNAGKFRGDIFYTSYIQREEEKLQKCIKKVAVKKQ